MSLRSPHAHGPQAREQRRLEEDLIDNGIDMKDDGEYQHKDLGPMLADV